MMEPRLNPYQAAPKAMTAWNRIAIGFGAVHPMKSGHAA
jgi:hypothetical protein